MFSRTPTTPAPDDTSNLSLPALLSKAILAFAIEFERDSEVSLAISANVLRRFDNNESMRVRDLPRLAGVSKEAIAMSLSFLDKQGYTVAGPESSGSRIKVLVLTVKGRRVHDAYGRLVSAIEEGWRTRFGMAACRSLRESLVKARRPTRRRALPGRLARIATPARRSSPLSDDPASRRLPTRG